MERGGEGRGGEGRGGKGRGEAGMEESVPIVPVLRNDHCTRLHIINRFFHHLVGPSL